MPIHGGQPGSKRGLTLFFALLFALIGIARATPLDGITPPPIDSSWVAYITGEKLGTICLESFGGDTRSPFLKVHIVHLTLCDVRDEKMFVFVANKRAAISRALIRERGKPYMFVVVGATVTGYAVSPPCCKDQRAHIALRIQDWIVLQQPATLR